jgi:hypothetical protein
MVNDLIPEQQYLYIMNAILLLSFFAVAFVIEKRFKTIHQPITTIKILWK